MKRLIDKVEERLGTPGLAAQLAGLSSSELTAVQLEVARLRAEGRTPAQVVSHYGRDRYVTPVEADARALRRVELELLEAAVGFEALELAPLGSCSTFSAGGQNRVLSAARSLEALADPTNQLALECAKRRRDGDSGALRLCTVARVTRSQPLQQAHHSRHFSLFAAVSAERHKDSRAFAREQLAAHIELQRTLHLAALRHTDGVAATKLELLATDEYRRVATDVADAFTDIPERLVEPLDSAYYAGLRFKLWIRLGAVDLPISDGGLFDWMRRLCSDRKEQLVTSAMGSELAVRLRAS